MVMLRVVVFLSFICIAAGPAAAQSLYVAGAVGAEMLVVSDQDFFGLSPATGGGQSISGAARLGVVMNERWGIELELSRAGEIRDTSRPGGAIPLGEEFPLFLPEIDLHTRITTISTTASIRQQVADRVALAYLGGVVFHRTDDRADYRARRGPPIFADLGFTDAVGSFGFPSARVESVRYGAGPVVGFEAHIGYGEHLTIVPSLRLHGLPGSWLLRPAVAVGWNF
jgi:hypothetical protein